MKVSQVSLPALLSDLCLLGGNLNCSFEWCIYLLIKLPTPVGSKEKQQNSRKTSTPASLTMLKSCVDHNKLWKILKEMGIPDHRPASWDICMQVKKQQLDPDWFQIGKGVQQGCNYYPAYLISMQSISHDMLGWMNHKVESLLLGEMSVTSQMVLL